MNMLKRSLAMLLTVCMLFSVVPFAALAEGVTEPVVETTAAEETVSDQMAAEETETSAVETEAETEAAVEETEAETEPVVEETEVVTAEVGGEAEVLNAKPADGTTSGQPFASGTGGSNLFRIPTIVTLSDGTLVAAADARWNDKNDRGNIDTIVSYSKDNGATWNYTFANYIADSGNSYDLSAATFIDPALAVKTVDGVETIYMLVDLFPGQTDSGNCVTTAQAGTGMNSNGQLLLSDSSATKTGTYYVGAFDETGYAVIYDAYNAATGYTVDAYYNVYLNGEEQGNLFTLKDTDFYVYQTSYLYLTKSTDGGATWSAPVLLNDQVKNSTETFYGVGPGAGLVTSTGRIIFPCYTYSNEYTSVIYSDDNGATWNRSASMSSSSSEATLVEVDGRIYMFTRYGGYYYSDDDGTTWSSKQSVGVSYTTTCELSALVYSKLIDGKTAILLSAPTSSRTTGKIFVGLVNEDKSITWAYTYTVNNSTYQYSSMTELADGSIGLLYENGDASITYVNLAISDIASGAVITTPDTDTPDEEETESVVTVKGYGEVTAVASTNANVETKLAGILTDYVAYDITVANYVEGTEVTVTMPIPEGVTNPAVYYVPEDGSDAVNMNATNNGNGTVSFVTNHFSTYVVGEGVTTQLVELTVGGSATVTDTTGNYANTAYTSTDSSIATMTVTGQDYAAGTVSYSSTSVKYSELATSTSKTKTAYYYSPDGTNYYPVYGYYATSNNRTTYYYGYSKTDSASDFMQINSSTKGSNTVTVYTKSGTEEVPVSTTITFTGVNVGTTTATVGNVTYTVKVNPMEATLYVQPGGTSTVAATGTVTDVQITAFNNANSGVVSVALTDGNLVFTAGTTETTTAAYLLGNTKYTIVVSASTSLTIDQYTSHSQLTLTEGQTVEWTSTDSTVATAIVNGTDVAIHGWKAGEATVTVKVYNADGSVASTNVYLVTVNNAAGSAGNTTFTYTVGYMEHCTVYYSINGGQLVEVEFEDGADSATITATSDGTNGSGYNSFVVYVAPDEGYALVGVTASSTSTSGTQYYKLNDDYTVTYSDSHSGNKLENFLVEDQETSVIAHALELGCDAIYWWSTGTSTSSKNCGTMYHYVVKLPEMDKEITSITHNGTTTAYTSGAKVAIGDTINYTITVYVPVNTHGSSYALNFTDFKVTDALTDGSWTQDDFSAPTSGGSTYTFVASATGETLTMSAVAYTYTTSLTLTQSNFADVVKNGVITNTAELNYNYSSNYSTGSYSASASASAEITVDVPSYVVDFGLPVKLDLSELVTAYGAIANAISANGWGSVVVNGSEVTYTPTSILQGIDYINLTFAGGSYAVAIYPATTVYYEESFLTYGDGWTVPAAPTKTQATEILDDKENSFGYDPAYASDLTGSNTTQATTSTVGASASFTFTGEGFELYANCTTATGWVTLLNEGGEVMKLYMVNTKLDADLAGETEEQSGDTFYNIPVVAEKNLPQGTYTVTVRMTKVVNEDAGTAMIDGIRIINTLSDSTVFTDDKEDDPEFYQLRDLLLFALGVDDATSGQYGTLSEMAEQVYNELADKVTDENGNVVAAIVADGTKQYTDNDSLQDLLDNGPKNEIYLYAGQTLTFKVKTSRALQIGMKAPNGATSYTISGATTAGLSGTMNTSVDMFYALGNATGTENTYTISVENIGSNILSITDLKICDDPNAAFVPLTVSDIEKILSGEPFEVPETSMDIDPPDPVEPVVAKVKRIAGNDRFLTAFAIADELKTQLDRNKFDTIIVACGATFPDALTGSYLAAKKNAPILLIDDKHADDVCDYIAANLSADGEVYILGGEAAVSKDAENAIKAQVATVKRLAGDDRIGTNLAILREAGVSDDQEILICTAFNYADSLSAASTGMPMLLVGKTLTEEQKQFLEGKNGKLTIIGGVNAVSEDIAAELGISDENRVAGDTRFETSILLAERYFSDVNTVVLAYAKDFPDGLCGGPLANFLNAPVILTTGDQADYDVADEFVTNVSYGYIMGGQLRINDDAARDIFDLPADAVITVE